ncbi:MAG TPA: DUF3267 domain-containing protein [Ktedonobacterales bacterium]|nr:DUF3267 domain-containing protein [Ktedonobacterales bacterium]
MIEASPPAPRTDAPNESARLVTRFVTRRRRSVLVEAIQRRGLRVVESLDLLAEDGLRRLATQSFWLLVGSGIAYTGLDVAARSVHGAGPLLGGGSPLLRGATLLLANAAAYIIMLPVHEALHASTILVLGGRPRFGLKLPLAAYCTAPGQLFTRNGYLAIAAAPVVVLTLAGAVATWVAPDLGACILLGLAGNISGAVADLWAIARIRHLPATALIEDTATGYSAYTLA